MTEHAERVSFPYVLQFGANDFSPITTERNSPAFNVALYLFRMFWSRASETTTTVPKQPAASRALMSQHLSKSNGNFGNQNNNPRRLPMRACNAIQPAWRPSLSTTIYCL